MAAVRRKKIAAEVFLYMIEIGTHRIKFTIRLWAVVDLQIRIVRLNDRFTHSLWTA